MSTRKFAIPRNSQVEPCPKCGNNTQFTARSEQVAEDGCEVWIVCRCGHDPHGPLDRMESVMGGCDDDNVREALGCWNDAVKSRREEKSKPDACPSSQAQS